MPAVCVSEAAVRCLELGSGSDTVSCEESGPGRPELPPTDPYMHYFRDAIACKLKFRGLNIHKVYSR